MNRNNYRVRLLIITAFLNLLAFTPASATGPHGYFPDPVHLQEILSQVQIGEKASHPGVDFDRLPPLPAAEPADPPQTWTYLFYDDADFTYAFDPWSDFGADAHGGDNVNVLVLRDTNADSARLYSLDAQHNYQLLENWGELDMGDPTTVALLLIYAKTHFPADRYAMAVYDHGGGWYGSCVDVTNAGWLTMDDMAAGLAAGGGLDLLMFTAPCLMGSLEAVHELRDVLDIYIGSEELAGYVDWNGAMDEFCTLLDNSAGLTTEEVGAQTLEILVDNSIPEYFESVAMGVTKASATSAIVEAVHDFAYYCLSHPTELKTEVAAALEATTRFGELFAIDREEVDLGDFADQALARISDPIARQHLTAIKDALDVAVVAMIKGSSEPRAQGLSIVFPETEAQVNDNYDDVALDMTDHTYWDEFIFWRLTDELPSGVPSGPALDLSLTCGPNPAPWTTQIRFSLPRRDQTTLRVFDLAGRLVATVCNDVLVEGPHSLTWDGKGDDGVEQASGVYLMRLESANRQATAKVMLVR